ncbi:MAG: hypothetical protein LBV38_01760 [Alistipes sp.]|nr:hypothetical protein [Alistipes sp.]
MISLCVGALTGILGTACDSNEPDFRAGQKTEQQQEADVPFAGYPLGNVAGDGEPAGWGDPDHANAPREGEVVAVDSDEELAEYIEGDYPAVDFSRKTLLLARGATLSGVHKATVDSLSQIADGRYRLYVTVFLNAASVLDCWHTAITTDKIEEGSEFELEVNFPRSWPDSGR